MRRMIIGIAAALASLTAIAGNPPTVSVTIANTPLAVNVVPDITPLGDYSSSGLFGFVLTTWSYASHAWPDTFAGDYLLTGITFGLDLSGLVSVSPDAYCSVAVGIRESNSSPTVFLAHIAARPGASNTIYKPLPNLFVPAGSIVVAEANKYDTVEFCRVSFSLSRLKAN